MEVSTDRPPRTAVAEAPLPRCSTTRLVSSTGRAEEGGGSARDDRRATCRGSRSDGSGARRATRAAPHRCTPPAASSGGRRCRTRRPAGSRGTAAAPRAALRGWPGCAAARAGPGPRRRRARRRRPASARRSGSPPWTTRCPTAARSTASIEGPCVSKASTAAASASSNVGNARVLPMLGRRRPRGPASRLLADPLDDPGRLPRCRFAVDQAVLQRRRAGVDDQHEVLMRLAHAGVTSGPGWR